MKCIMTKTLLLGTAAAALAGICTLDPALAEPPGKVQAAQGARAKTAAPAVQNGARTLDSGSYAYSGTDRITSDWNQTWRGDPANDFSRFRGFFPWGGYPYWNGGY